MSKGPTISRRVIVPDHLRLERFRRAPEIGPEVLFFSGGSALKATSRVLTEYTHNSAHLITPFDSGGSSAVLRKAFSMIAVGDLRNRLMALADTKTRGHPEVYRLFGHRLPHDAPNDQLRARVEDMAAGTEPLMAAVPSPLRKLIQSHIRRFCKKAPPDFDLRGASIGNLVLAGGYLQAGQDMDSVLFLFSKLVQVRGMVRPVVDDDLHLVAELEDGRVLVGQHLITGRTAPPIDSPIRELRLSSTLETETPATTKIDSFARKLIERAEVIVFPIGSFFTSVMACLLPEGVADAICAAGCPKVYVPNTGRDPEQLGLSPVDCVARLKAQLSRGCTSAGCTPRRQLDVVLVDSRRGDYTSGLDLEALAALDVTIVDTALVTDQTSPKIDPRLLAEALLSLT
jgi:CofD-related protein of GAK system